MSSMLEHYMAEIERFIYEWMESTHVGMKVWKAMDQLRNCK